MRYYPRYAALAFLGLAGCARLDGLCDGPSCRLSGLAWERLSALASLPPPPEDPANKYVGDGRAERLGQMLFFDARFSGRATGVDVLGRAVPAPARAAVGQPVGLACASCHDPARGGVDHVSVPGNVSVGAGWYDVNASSVVNAAYYQLKYWNGRYDSLVWQILAVTESPVSMNGNRLRVLWALHDYYRADYQAVFTAYPLPELGETAAELGARLEPNGQCQLTGTSSSTCPEGCVVSTSTTTGDSCWPRFPLEGKQGRKAGCQHGDPAEPFGDAYDCMAAEDKETVIRTYVNYAKAIAAYEFRLTSRPSAFDRWVGAGPDSELISPAAQRGAALFVGKASCIECHNTPLFSDSRFHNVGAPQAGATVPTEADCVPGRICVALGFHAGLQALQAGTTFRIDGKYSDHPEDRSRQAYYTQPVTDALKGTWRTPSLREVARTAPYMHDGVYATIREVIEHYDRGGTQDGSAPDQVAPQISALFLSEQEKDDLAAFLDTLTGDPLPSELSTAPELPK